MRWIARALEVFARRASARRRHCGVAVLAAAIGLSSAEAAASRDLTRIGVIVGDLGNPFFEQIARDVADEAARRIGPSVTVVVRSSGYDIHRQIRQIDTMVADGVDLLVLNAVDTERIGPAVQKARDAGVVVVAIDVRAENAEATITSDNRGAGRVACRYLAERLAGKGTVLVLNGPPVSSVVERVEGCREILSGYPSISIIPDEADCGGSIEGGLAQATDVLTKYPHMDAIFAINDPTAIGADIAASRAGRSEFFIVAIDGSPHGADVLRRPGTRLAATVVQDPKQMSEKAMDIGMELFAGRETVERNVETPVYLLTKKDLDTKLGWRH